MVQLKATAQTDRDPDQNTSPTRATTAKPKALRSHEHTRRRLSRASLMRTTAAPTVPRVFTTRLTGSWLTIAQLNHNNEQTSPSDHVAVETPAAVPFRTSRRICGTDLAIEAEPATTPQSKTQSFTARGIDQQGGSHERSKVPLAPA
jgi:hypothetical protein